MPEPRPLVGVIMGSKSDWDTMRHADEMLARFDIPHESRIVSAHRTPSWMSEYATTAIARGLEVIIAGAGGATLIVHAHQIAPFNAAVSASKSSSVLVSVAATISRFWTDASCGSRREAGTLETSSQPPK